ncbi:MAG: cyclic nucleotide-binding domain-containing protein [Deltaproteobacteria bacterium]|nr:cyclic nucleotide-binding domain-containing protein [Deltaproteobacteria bacterium]MBW2069890.1 cyclic nucleotide-binding domain-containing protein [Deltaproteobacteria bacterium]
MHLSRTVEYQNGEHILQEGKETQDIVFVLLEGQAKVIKNTEKGPMTLALLEEGDIFGEAAFLAQRQGKRSASIVANGQVKVGVLDQQKLEAEYNKLSPTFKKLLRDLALRFTKTTALTARLAPKRLKAPSMGGVEQRRGKALQALRIKVDYLPAKKTGYDSFSGQDSYKGMLLDLAPTCKGLELYTVSFSKLSHPIGGKFIFGFTLPGKPMMRIPGQIAWLRELGGNKARMGIQFTESNPYFEKIIKEFLREISP